MIEKNSKLKENTYIETDILLVGSGASALYFALNAPKNLNIFLISKSNFEESDSFLAQGGICMMKNKEDFDSFFMDTLEAGHYKNDIKSVEIMIRSSQKTIESLIDIGVDFQKNKDGNLDFTKEGCHSKNRILFHKDITGKEITQKLLDKSKKLENVKMHEKTSLIDLVTNENSCLGGVIREKDGSINLVKAKYTVLATGGIGGLYKHSTNFSHLTGDSIAIALNHQIELKDLDCVQVHPTTLYTQEDKRSFLISESTRGEGAKLYGKDMERFTDELQARDKLTEKIREKMEKDKMEFIWQDLRPIGKENLSNHFPNIVKTCEEEGYSALEECIPVVPAQHYLMGGIKTDQEGRTSMDRLYAIGETACNGVHGENRLASNSLLEALVFSKRAAKDIEEKETRNGIKKEVFKNEKEFFAILDPSKYQDLNFLSKKYTDQIKNALEKAKKSPNQTAVEYRKEEKLCLIK